MSADKPWLEGAVSVSDGSPQKRGKDIAEKDSPHPFGIGLREGIAVSVGNIADAPSRLYNLGKAAIGSASIVPTMGGNRATIPSVLGGMTGRPASDFIPELTPYNAGTDALRKLLGVTGKPQQGESGADAIYRATGEGIGSSIVGANPMQSLRGLGIETLKMLGIGGMAGAGGEYGSQVTDGSTAGRIAGSLVGGVALPAFGGMVGVGTRLFRNAQDAAKDPANAQRVNTLAGRIIDKQVKDAISGTPPSEGARNITEALDLQQKIPGFNPSVAEMVNSPGMSDMQRRYALTSPAKLNEEVAREAANRAAINQYYGNVAPTPPSTPSSVRTAANQALAAESAQVTGQGRAVAGQLPIANPLDLGNQLKTIADAEKASAKSVVGANYRRAFDAAGQDKVVDLSSVVAKVEDILGERLSQIKPENAPNTVAKIKQLFGASEGRLPEEQAYLASVLGGDVSSGAKKSMVSLEEADAIRKAINQDIASGASSTNPAASYRLRNLGQVHSALDEAINTSGLKPEAKELYSQAISKYRTEYVPRFKEGANLRTFRDSNLNEPRILPDKMVSEYFKPDEQGGLTRASQFSSLFGRNKEAKETFEKGILDSYRNDVVDKTTGIIDVGKHNQFIRQYGRTLDSYKGSGVDAATRIETIGKQAQEAATAISRFDSLAKGLRFDSTDELITKSLSDPKVMGNITQRLTPQAKKTFSRLLMDKAMESGSAAGIQKYLNDNAKTLSMVLDQKHLDNLKDISNAVAIVERAPISGALQSSGPDILKNATGLSTATVWSQWRATTGGRQSPVTAAFNLSMPVLNKLSQQQFGDLMENALHNPETAKALRHFLLAETPKQANVAGSVLSSLKLAGGVLWSSKGAIANTLFGADSYAPMLRMGSPAISEQMTREVQQ